MTDAGNDGRGAIDEGRLRFSSADVLSGLVASFAWTMLTLVGVGESRSVTSALVVFGCAASKAVPLVVGARMLGSTSTAASPIEAAVLVVLAPVALFAGGIQTHTHHRALGAVTFAAGATFVFGVTALVTRRIVRESASGSRLWRMLRAALGGACGLSLAWILWTLARASRDDGARAAMVDGALGLVAVTLGVRAPRVPVPAFLLRLAPALFVTVVGAGLLALWKNAPEFAILCERAPVTLGIPPLFKCR
jgi:hypothetical protein